MKTPSALVAVATLFLSACSGADLLEEDQCPDQGTTLTYENFGQVFFYKHCLRCHGDANAYSSRSFTTLGAIQSQRDRIYANAAAGNTFMPPGPDDPTEQERDDLAEWLVCGAP